MATIADIEVLQDGISASLQTLLRAYDRCPDPVQCADLLNQARQLAAQMSRIETGLFHQQALQADAAIDRAFISAGSCTGRLKDMAGSLDRVSDIISTAAKLVADVTQIIGFLAL